MATAITPPIPANAAELQNATVMLLSPNSTRVVFDFGRQMRISATLRRVQAGFEVDFPGASLAHRTQGFPGLSAVQSVDCESYRFGTRCTIVGADLREARESLFAYGLSVDVTTSGVGNQTTTLVQPNDAPRSGVRTSTKIYSLVFADSSEVANLLVTGSALSPNDSFSPVPSALGQANSTSLVPASVAASVSAAGVTDSVRVNDEVAVDRRRNLLIVTADEARQRVVQDIIAAIDKPMPSVMLEAEIVELDENSARDVGLDTSPNGSLAQATFGGRDHQGPTASVNFAANLYAAITKGHGRVLAQPRVLATSGLSASILTGSALPILTSIAFPGSGGSFVQQQVQYINVGVNLQILPRVNRDGSVTVRLYSAVSSVTGYVQGIPEVSQREATTLATTQDGAPVVIGGLVQRQELDQMSKLPGASSLPIIGGLFKVHHDSALSTLIYVVVTPRVVTPGGS
ncbi:MAG: hypothetical protein JOZ86_06275 [Candidatus Eremiobacteraeota bacterium]|nr:hypothetical protein [Candidatus Eremiobacteraeota bacterium]